MENELDATGPGRIWQRYELAFFEYHCYEGHDSADAELWYRSHQPVMVLGVAEGKGNIALPEQERYEGAALIVYKVRFADGHVGTVFEDELMDDERGYYRPDPPARPTTPKVKRSPTPKAKAK